MPRRMRNCAIVSLCSLAAMLAAHQSDGFVSPLGLNPISHRTSVTTASYTSLGRTSRRWDKQQQADAGGAESGGASDQAGGPFSWVKNAAGKLGRGSSSRASKKQGQVDDLLNSEAFLKKKVDMLQKQIVTTREEIEAAEAEAEQVWQEWGPQIERLEKEFQLLKSRGGDAATKAFDKGKAEAINDILVVADNFERAAGAINAQTDGERAVVAYYEEAYDTMMGCLHGLGLTEVETIGSQFDYNIHNAIMRQSSDEFPEDVVCQVFQKGYRFDDTLVRPAMVAVAVS